MYPIGTCYDPRKLTFPLNLPLGYHLENRNRGVAEPRLTKQWVTPAYYSLLQLLISILRNGIIRTSVNASKNAN
jgi:hypothetical protein